ncbi:hypothetical protein BDW62DRAFT_175047 [Aspergillus aurantiobrunneus]
MGKRKEWSRCAPVVPLIGITYLSSIDVFFRPLRQAVFLRLEAKQVSLPLWSRRRNVC